MHLGLKSHNKLPFWKAIIMPEPCLCNAYYLQG